MSPGPEQAPGLPAGKTTFDLPLGRLRIRIVDLPTTWKPFVEDNYSPFAEPPLKTASPHLTVTCSLGSGLIIPLPEAGETPVIELTEVGEARFEIRSHYLLGVADLTSGTGSLQITSMHPVHLRMSVENFLRVTSQLLFPKLGSFLMHSAGIVDDGHCYLFFGQSGSGKSTITELSAPRLALSDDMVLVDVGSTEVTVHAVPFFGAYPMKKRTRGAFPAAGAYRLRQSSQDRLVPLSAARAVATVSASVPFVHDLGVRHHGLLDLVTTFCQRVSVADLRFSRSDRFWSVIKSRQA